MDESAQENPPIIINTETSVEPKNEFAEIEKIIQMFPLKDWLNV